MNALSLANLFARDARSDERARVERGDERDERS